MSCITENTMIINKKDEDDVRKDYLKYKDTYHRISGFKRIYTDNKISIYVFDANGDSPWELEADTVVPIALETNYLTGERPWTRINGKTYGWPLKRWLKGKIPDEEYSKVRKSIAYSV